jgi:hypothetical protein
MIYDKGTSLGSVWHCPFEPEWVERTRRTVSCCKSLSDEYIEMVDDRQARHYEVPTLDFLHELQDARGLPLSWCEEEQRRQRKHPHCRASIYDYSTEPDVVVTNGEDDWPLRASGKVLLA